MITPDEIRKKAQRAYPRMLAAWAQGDLSSFFPWHVPANLSPVVGDVTAAIAAVETLVSSGVLDRADRIVIFNTGAGWLYR